MAVSSPTTRRIGIFERLFALGYKISRKYDRELIFLFFAGLFGAVFFTQPILLGLNQHLLPAVESALDSALWDWPWAEVLRDLVIMMLVGNFAAMNPALLIWMERKISGHMQSRPGPLHTGGWHGYLQTIADGIKLISKEDIIPAGADKVLHTLAPLLVVTIMVSSFVVIPFGNEMISADFNIGLVYLLAISSVEIFGIVIAGWASDNKYSLVGGMRSAAQLVSYEIPRAFSIIGVIMMAETVQMSGIVGAQETFPFALYQPIAFVLFLIASIAETNRVPFDLPEAESELVAGFHTEYSGMKFAFFFMAEYGNVVLFSALATALFLGGGNVPFLEPILASTFAFQGGLEFLSGFWHFPLFVLKTYLLVFFFIWVRWTYPRLRVDRLMDFTWKILLPWTLLNVIFLGLALVTKENHGLIIFALVNWLIVAHVLHHGLKK